MTSNVKYSRLSTSGDSDYDYSPRTPTCSLSKACGVISCFLIATCVFLSIAIAKVLEDNRFLRSQYTNYTSSYSFGVASGLQIDLSNEQCCTFETQYSCLCCPNNVNLMNTTFASFVTVLKMYVNTKFILYLGNIASDKQNTIKTYSYFSDFINQSEVSIPVFPTLGINDRPANMGNYELYYSEIYQTWINLINCFDCPLAPSTEGVKYTVTKGGYYSISTTYGIRIISINTNLFLNDASEEEREEAIAQLKWLDIVFLNARDSHQSKILIGGSAPGLSSDDILVKKVNTSSSSVGDWDPDFQVQFTALLNKHEYRFAAIMMGGTEYELVRKLNHQYMLLTPPCSPLQCSNPAFRVAFLSERDLELLDLHQYYSPIEFFTRVNKTPKYMFDYSYERIIFGSEQPRGPVYLNAYSISVLYETFVKSFQYSYWESLMSTKNVLSRTGITSPLVTYCTTQYSNKTLQLGCLKKYKYL